MLSVIMLSVIMLNVIMLNDVMLNVVPPFQANRGQRGAASPSLSMKSENLQTFDCATFNVQFYSKTTFLLLVRC
jgi:hypothetical protein